LAEELLVLDVLVPLLLELGLAVAFFKAEFKRPVEHVEARRELQESVHL